MRKISDYKDEEALDLLADIIEPASNIFADDKVKNAFKGSKDKSMIKVAKVIIENHKGDIMEILAKLDGKKREDFHCNVLTLPIAVLQILQDKELVDFFSYAVENAGKSVSIDAMGNIGVTGED